MPKKVNKVATTIDATSLLDFGWQLEDFQARLATVTYDDDGDYYHTIAISGILNFLPDAWKDRFSRGEYTCWLLIKVDAPSRNLAWTFDLITPKIKKAKKAPFRFSESEILTDGGAQIQADDIVVSLLPFDSTWVGDALKSDTPRKSIPLPVEIEDQTSNPGLHLVPEIVARYSPKEDCGYVIASGTVTIGSAYELARAHMGDLGEEPGDGDIVADNVPFSVRVPEIEIELYDETGFILDSRRTSIELEVPVTEKAEIPARRPRWYLDYRIEDSSGQPARVVARIVDAD